MTEPAPLPAGEAQPALTFCGYCAARVEAGEGSRVCPECNMGLLLRAAAGAVPETGDAFLVVDDAMAVRALSRRAEKLLGISETAAVDRHVGELLEEAADDEAGTPRLSEALAGATRGSRIGELPLSPRNAFGVRWWARVAPCSPGPAAVVVLVERL